MALELWSQDSFSRGELSPLMYSRVTVEAYYKGLKTARNVIALPQGAAAKRFGTIYVNEVTGITNYKNFLFESFQYLNECVYLLVFIPNQIKIYLEGRLVATVTGTGFDVTDVQQMDYTILENRFRVTTGIHRPKDLRRTASTPHTISSAASNQFTVTTPFTNNIILPVRFTTTGTLPVTNPPLHVNRTYFIHATSTTTVKVYATAVDAAADTNAFTITNAGTGTNNIVPFNNWTFSNVTFSNLPQFDFTGGYDNLTFTPAAMSGAAVNLTASGNIFTSAHVGGAFQGGGGIARITSVTSPTVAVMAIVRSFDGTAAIAGELCLLTEPAWSDTRGWPRKCSSFQNRALFANTDLLPNGFWASYTNVFDDFNDIEDEDDAAISWLPTSDTINYIQFIVPYRSLTIHTNSGIYSTPLSVETAITPDNFSMSLQDSTPAERVQPRGIDNQIIVLSGNDAHSLLWDGFNNAYTSNIISIANEQLIRTPIDEAAYTDLSRAGSRYMFIVNDDGTLAIYQTLIAENVSGFTPAYLEQSYGNAYFRSVTSNFDGRAWFLTERQLATSSSTHALIGNTTDTFEATGSNFSISQPTACLFTATTALPTTLPQIETSTWYWAIGVDANHFKVYLTQEDAESGTNAIQITNHGTGASVVKYPLTTHFFIEELSFEAKVDCAGFYDGAASSTISGQTRFNAQDIQMQGDGFGFSDMPVGGNVVFEAHGVATPVSDAQYGFPINVEIVPMPIAIPMGGNQKTANLVEPKHIRVVTLLFSDTVGGTVNNTKIQLNTLKETIPGLPPIPKTGEFELSLMKGWNDLKYPSLTIRHSEPFDFKLTGIFYKVDI